MDIESILTESDDITIDQTKHKSICKRTNVYKSIVQYFGPAFVVSVAYFDPGNFATNICGGSKFNYSLIWVVLWSNVMAIFLQIMSAKLGIATGRNLAQMCALVFKRRTNWLFWIVAELGAMATDLAEFLGGTLGLYLLFRIPMLYAGILVGILTFILCYIEKYGQKVIELIICVLISVISIAYTIEVFLAQPAWITVGFHTLIPSLPGKDAVLIAVGMLGATVMPHVIYYHSQLVQFIVQDSSTQEKQFHFKMEKLDVIIAMNIAFLINAAMVIVSAAAFYKNGIEVHSIEQAHQSLAPLLGTWSSGWFGIALLASGLSSSAVGTLAGQVIMKGFVNLCIPVNIRRVITMLPALLIIALQINPIQVLVFSQVVLSFILPFPIIQMLLIAKRKDIMGSMVNNNITRCIGVVIASIIIILNAALLYLTLF